MPELLKNILKALKQRMLYIKNYKKGFSFIFILPGFMRAYFGDTAFFSALTNKNKSIHLEKSSAGQTRLIAGEYNFIFPPRCFYEGDFFDIVYPHLNLHDDLIDALVYNNPYYESEGVYDAFGAVLCGGDYVIDAGANVGMFSIIASKSVGPTGKIFAFEPLKEVSVFLERNILNNNIKNVVVENLLLGEKAQAIDFYHNLDRNFNAASKKFKHDDDTVTNLQQVTLDNYVELNKIPKIDFIKADIEGAERDLLKGAEKTIKKYRPKIAIRTYHLPDDSQVLENILKMYVPEYTIKHHKKTLYAWVNLPHTT